jgi:hypothetical protein
VIADNDGSANGRYFTGDVPFQPGCDEPKKKKETFVKKIIQPLKGFFAVPGKKKSI